MKTDTTVKPDFCLQASHDLLCLYRELNCKEMLIAFELAMDIKDIATRQTRQPVQFESISTGV